MTLSRKPHTLKACVSKGHMAAGITRLNHAKIPNNLCVIDRGSEYYA